MSAVTKKALSESLIKLLKEKPLSKITISDITGDSGMNRHTFYYHFRDINDLIVWTLETSSIQAMEGKTKADDWTVGFLALFDWAKKNQNFILSVYHYVSIDYIYRFFYEKSYKLLRSVVDDESVGLRVKEEDKDFIANFYKFGLVGLVIEWLDSAMMDDPKRIVDKLSLMINGDIRRCLEKFDANRTKTL